MNCPGADDACLDTRHEATSHEPRKQGHEMGSARPGSRAWYRRRRCPAHAGHGQRRAAHPDARRRRRCPRRPGIPPRAALLRPSTTHRSTSMKSKSTLACVALAAACTLPATAAVDPPTVSEWGANPAYAMESIPFFDAEDFYFD